MNPDLVHVLERYASSRGPSRAVDAALAGVRRAHARPRARRVEPQRGAAGGARAPRRRARRNPSAESLRALAPRADPSPRSSPRWRPRSRRWRSSRSARARASTRRARRPCRPPALRPLTVAVTRVLSGRRRAWASRSSPRRSTMCSPASPRRSASWSRRSSGSWPTCPRRAASRAARRACASRGAARVAAAAAHARRLLRRARAQRGRRRVGLRRHARRGQGRAERRALRAQGPRVLGERRAEPERGRVPEACSATRPSALIALPQHPNLARFVTFDAGSKPKPILVMELVEGTTLEHLLEARGLDTVRALKASSTTSSAASRRCTPSASATSTSSRRTSSCAGARRPCSSTSASPGGTSGRAARPAPTARPRSGARSTGARTSTPAKADVYAFGCVAFETLTGRVLFDADSEMAQIAMHVAHDGFPPPLQGALQAPGALAPIAELLFSTLRHKTRRSRPTAAVVRKELARVAPSLARGPWPLGLDSR